MSKRGERLRLLEALIFAAGEPVGEEILSSRLEDAGDLSDLLRELREIYAGRGLNLVRLAGGWTFRTAPDLASRLFIERRIKKKLSRAAVETLAVIAYRQPVTRGEIEEMRGVGLGKGTLALLMETGWVRPKGRRASPGRPLLWVTTPAFLVHFGLDSLEDLPRLDEISAARAIDVEEPHALSSKREKTELAASPGRAERGGDGA